MTRNSFVLAGFLALGAAVALAEDKPKNLIENPSLEGKLEDTGLPKGWSFGLQPENGYRFEVVKGGRTGDKSLLLEGKGEWAVVVTGHFPIDPKKQYIARGWVKVEGDARTEASVKFDYFDGDDKFLGQSWPGAVPVGTKDWQGVAHRDRVAAWPGAKFLSVTVALTRNGKAWFDDLELVTQDIPKSMGNLLVNGDLEDHAGDRAAFWHVSCNEGGTIDCRRIVGQPKAGVNSLHLQGKGDWGVAGSEKVEFDRKKTYTLTAFARTKSGSSALAFSYWKGDAYLGNSLSDEVTTNERQKRTVVAEPDKFPDATHIGAVVGWHKPGEVETWFDSIELTAK